MNITPVTFQRINSDILNNVIIEDDVMIGAGSLVPPRKRLKSRYLHVGSSVQQARPLTDKEKAFLTYSFDVIKIRTKPTYHRLLCRTADLNKNRQFKA